MLDHQSYPHILDTVINHLDLKGLHVMRLTNRATNDKVCSILYRHIVVALRSSSNNRIRLLDPYDFKTLVFLDCNNLASASRRTPGTQELIGVSLEEGLRRLTTYTKIVDFRSDPRFHHGIVSVLGPIVPGVKITREVSIMRETVWGRPAMIPPFAYTNHRSHRPALFLNFKFGSHRAVTFYYDLALTRGLVKSSDKEFIVVVRPTIRKTCDCCNRPALTPASAAHGIFPVLLTHLERWGGPTLSKTTFIKAKTSTLPATEWDDFVDDIAGKWASRASNSNWPMTFSHVTPEDFQQSSGLSDFDLALFTTAPSSKVPRPVEWLS
ncbi:uncharacterized protein LOC62_07G008955 [Vanrija pseudolonga]|uniref:Uncharacterized protein n=1 Tax=Vanrija pseudolonga TaxID=143232 RepID=A0AAF0YJ37_9TREE|nr:hypothetical protein LOC62_07G008955 [Vanrija pseudolonga]